MTNYINDYLKGKPTMTKKIIVDAALIDKLQENKKMLIDLLNSHIIQDNKHNTDAQRTLMLTIESIDDVLEGGSIHFKKNRG